MRGTTPLKCILAALFLAAPLLASAQNNIAFRRAVYQSGSLDFNHTGQLVTDGIYTVDDFEPPVASDAFGDCKMDERADNLFDGKAETLWITHHVPNWALIEFPGGESRMAATYSLTSNLFFSNRDPRSWTVEGSNDGEEFVILDTRKDERFTGRQQTRRFIIGEPGDYRFYRLTVTESGRPDLLHIAEWDLYGTDGASVISRNPLDENVRLDSRWISPADGQEHWLYVDLGRVSLISAMELRWNDKNWAEHYDIEYSNDARSWTRVTGNYEGGGGTETFIVDGPPARYVRLLCRKSTGDRFELIEWKVFGHGDISGQEPALRHGIPAHNLKEYRWTLERASEAATADGTMISSAGFDDSGWLPAEVPGTVLRSHLLAGAIPDPDYGNQHLMISDSYFTADFWYRSAFRIPRPEKDTRVWLNFDAVNWKAEVYLNGRYLGRIDGAFIRGKFDITEIADLGGENYMAVLIRKNDTPGPVTVQDYHSPGLNGGILGADSPTIHASVGWDWIPTIRGRNIGIYNDVYLTFSRDVVIRDPWVLVDMDVENRDYSKATLTVRTELHNASTEPAEVVVEGEITPGGITFRSGKYTLTPGETREVTVAENIVVDTPRLWWPNTYGEPFLYSARLRADSGGATSDEKEFRFGVRKFTYREDFPMTVYCNGVRIVCRGGNWGMDDSNLAATTEDYDIKVRMHAEANLNMIRNWVGMTGNKEFYNACDRYGILVWDDFWLANPSDGPDPGDEEMFIRNAVDKIKRNRYHACLALYCGRNEGDPPPSLNARLECVTRELDGTRIYIPHSAANTVSGFGPYTVQDNEWYFRNTDVTLHSERGMPNVPALESLVRMLPPENRWPIDDVWGIHDFTQEGAQGGANFISRMERYGSFDDIASFARTAQMVNYEGHKSMFEAVYTAGAAGMIMWMSQSAWPSMVWQTYDYYYDTNAGYFGIKKANQPVNTIYNYTTGELVLTNVSGKDMRELTVKVQLYSLNGEFLRETTGQYSPESDERLTVSTLDMDSHEGLVFIKSYIYDCEGVLIADNFTWMNPSVEHDMRGFSSLRESSLECSVEKLPGTSAEAGFRFRVANTGQEPSLLVRIKAVDTAEGTLITPAYFDDNYFSLMPGEEKVVTVKIPQGTMNGRFPGFYIEGWNKCPERIY